MTDSSLEVSAYRSRAWADTFQSAYGEAHVLEGQHRQATASGPLASILSRLRFGRATMHDITTLNMTWGDDEEKWHDAVHLRATNADVNKHNAMELELLPGSPVVFKSMDIIVTTHPDRAALAEKKLNHLAPQQLVIKPGAVVVLNRSLGDDVMAGARGVVVSVVPGISVTCKFDDHERPVMVGYVVFDVKENLERTLASRQQVLLLLAWALTVSRAQGLTLSDVAVDFSCTRWTLDGLVYSALSRATSLDKLHVKGLTYAHIRVSAHALALYRDIEAKGGSVP